jgi:broad specificity polyphosphatase/5'/3'-nucleotidase SurE
LRTWFLAEFPNFSNASIVHGCNAGQSEEVGSSDTYVWSPTGLRVFQQDNPEPGGDVAAVKAGNVSITPLRTAFLHGTAE